MNRERTSLPLEGAAHLAGESQGSPVLSAEDERLEMQIEATRQALVNAKTRGVRLELQETMKQQIAMRSAWAIAIIEKQKGLR